jgi:hypothetical protein
MNKRLIDSANQTGKHWELWELEIPDGITELIIQYGV